LLRNYEKRFEPVERLSSELEPRPFFRGLVTMVRMRRASEIVWYLYRSTTKLDMLYDQLVSSAGPFAGSFSLEIPGAKATVNTSRDEPPTDEERLEVIEKELRKRSLVGTVHEPREFFGGQLPMRWGLFNDQGNRPADDAPLVFFGGIEREKETIVGLGGSSRHVVGHEGASSTYSRSTTPAIVRWMLAGLADVEPVGWADPEGEKQQVLSGVAIALHYLRPPTQNLRFLAKTLLTGRIPGHEHMTGLSSGRAVLGTPIYVSLVDPLPEEDRWGLDDKW
jgi:hypothetical protein